MALAMLLQSLVEASNDAKDTKAKGNAAEEQLEENPTVEDSAAEENAEENPDEESGANDEDNPDEGSEEEPSEDENQDDQSEEENPEDTPEEDDFSLDPTEGGEDEDEENPDGLVDPDDDGSSEMEEEDVEMNIQTNVLQLSKLDRTLAKRKCYNDFMDMRTTITSVKNIISENEVVIDPDVRTSCMEKLEQLYNYVTDYIKFKFMITNYEENLQNYMIFLKTLNEIVLKIVPASGNKGKSKKSQN